MSEREPIQLDDLLASARQSARDGYSFTAAPHDVATVIDCLITLAAMYDGTRLPNACSAAEHFKHHNIAARP